jgi:REP element-mobilizing transposase RayT
LNVPFIFLGLLLAMAQSLVKNYLHIIFSTKYRLPLIEETIEDEVFRYLGGICKNLECLPLAVGGYLDHVHILCNLSKKITLIKLVEEVKKESSKWIKTLSADLEHFYWQGGYAAFSVNPTRIEQVKNYIRNQKKHHKELNYSNELRFILEKNQMEYDEKYLWD